VRPHAHPIRDSMKMNKYKIKPERASHMNHDLRTILVKADINLNRHHLITTLTPLRMDADQFMQEVLEAREQPLKTIQEYSLRIY